MSPTDSTPQDQLRAPIVAQSRWQIAFALLALLLPLVPYLVFERQARRLDKLADHGKPAVATVTRVARNGASTNLIYAYAVDGASFSWTVPSDQVPHAPGETFDATYLPEDPSLSRPDAAQAASDAEETRTTARKAMLLVFAFFLVNVGVSEVKLRRMRKEARAAGANAASVDAGAGLSPIRIGQLVALFILSILVATNFNEDTMRVQAKAFGPGPLGLSIAVWTSAVQTLLFIPYFWIIPHLIQILVRARRDRAPLTRGGLVWYIAHVHQRHADLARSRTIVLSGRERKRQFALLEYIRQELGLVIAQG